MSEEIGECSMCEENRVFMRRRGGGKLFMNEASAREEARADDKGNLFYLWPTIIFMRL